MENLIDRRGHIYVSRELLKQADINFLKLLYGNFYPIAIDEFGSAFNRPLKIYGVSEHFEELEEGTIIPEYEVIIHSDENGDPIKIEFNLK